MAYKYPLNGEWGREYPNWLSSEVGLTLKTHQFNSADVQADANGKKIVKSGSVVSATVEGSTVYYGIAYKDIDVTLGDLEGSIMVGGRVYENRLPATVTSAQKTGLGALGIIFDTAPEVTRA